MSDFIGGKPPDRAPSNGPEITAVIIVGLLFAALMGGALLEDWSIYKLSLPFFVVSYAVLLVIHEFGHALMARALGWRVEKVSIGTGKLLAKKKIFGMKTEFRAIPLSGYAIPRPNDLIQPQMKSSLIYAAGPGIEIALVAVIVLFVGVGKMLSHEPDILLIALQSFSAAALLGALINLVPLPFQSENGAQAWSDGLGIILSWKIPDEVFAKMIRD